MHVRMYIHTCLCVGVHTFTIDTGQIVNVSFYVRKHKTNLDHKLSQFTLFYCYRRIKPKNLFSTMVSQTYITK